MTVSIAPNDGREHVREAHAEGWQAKEGCYRFQSCTTPEGRPSVSIGYLPPPLVVPIIFVPGIMGSNLKAGVGIRNRDNKIVISANTPVWRVDSTVALAKEWLNRKQDQYQLRFQHDKVAVDDRGDIPVDSKSNKTPNAGLTEAQARDLGWGTVSAAFYGDFLDWLDGQLNQPGRELRNGELRDNQALSSLKQTVTQNPLGVQPGFPEKSLSPEDLDLLLKVDNPVHAFGYNWLQSNARSGQELAEYIDTAIAEYNQDGRSCKQVILVTHSMGGLVARAACQIHGAASKVAGVFHGVMPTDGAAATYKRMVSGFGGEPTHGLIGWIKDWIGSAALGPTGDYVTPALALNAGPLELLPNARYNQGKAWLIVKDKDGEQIKGLPVRGDPYTEIYLEQEGWWRLLNPEWLNPAGLSDNVLEKFGIAIDQSSSFHTKVQAADDFHPVTHAHYGMDADHLAYGTVTWSLSGQVDAERNVRLQRERLPNVAQDTGMRIYLRDGDWGVHALLSEPDAAGDGTVPAKASAMAVDAGVKPGHLLARGNGYSHDASYDRSGTSEGPAAALQSIVRMLSVAVVAS